MQQPFRLQHGDGQIVEVLLCTMLPRHLSQFNTIWKSILEDMDEADTFWDWARKKELSLTNDRYEAYALEHDSLAQGLMWIETQWHRSQMRSRQPLVYVEALASAPWNRGGANPNPWIKGVGTALLLFARKRSLQLGYQGRLGLHALPGSESFYEDRNMLNFGYDPDREMVYFEYGSTELTRRLEDDYDL